MTNIFRSTQIVKLQPQHKQSKDTSFPFGYSSLIFFLFLPNIVFEETSPFPSFTKSWFKGARVVVTKEVKTRRGRRDPPALLD